MNKNNKDIENKLCYYYLVIYSRISHTTQGKCYRYGGLCFKRNCKKYTKRKDRICNGYYEP